jgi:RNA polymerase sigma-70 factor (ECF subfamily)
MADLKVHSNAGEERERFEKTILPHLESAYNLAYWLTRNAHDAEDLTQEACLRAHKFFGTYSPGDGQAWLLRIVRNTCYTWMEKRGAHASHQPFDEALHSDERAQDDPAARMIRADETEWLARALEDLPMEYREVIVLRDLEGLPYKKIAAIAEVPLGTVMSRLARGRDQLQQLHTEAQERGVAT